MASNKSMSTDEETGGDGDVIINNFNFGTSGDSSRRSPSTTAVYLESTGPCSSSRTPANSTTAKYDITGGSTGKTPQTSRSINDNSLAIVGLVCGRGQARNEIGFAWLDLRYPQLQLSQFADTTGYSRLRSKLQAIAPIEIVVPETAVGNQGHMRALVHLFATDLPDTQIVTVHRKYFNEGKGLQYVNALKNHECSHLDKELFEKYYCLASASALIKYVEFIQNMSFAHESIKITYEGTKNTCMIDPVTVKHLELIVSLKDCKNSESSLFGVMNGTFSGCASRLLRSNVLQPPTDLHLINQRLDAVTQLLHNELGFNDVRSVVSRVVDVEQMVALCVNVARFETSKSVEYKITQILHVKHTLLLIPSLSAALRPFHAPLFKQIKEVLEDERYEQIVDMIGEVIDDDVQLQKGALNMRTQKCFAVKLEMGAGLQPGINGLLDVARRTYTELMVDVNQCVADAAEESALPFRTAFTVARGFYMQLLSKEVGNGLRRGRPLEDMAPDWCLNVVAKRTALTCTTRTLIRLNDRLTQCVNEIYLIAQGIVASVLGRIRTHVACLYNLTEAHAHLDVLVALAQFSSLAPGTVVRPSFSSVLAVKQGRHPVLERFASSEVTANDTFASAESPFSLITGPNMAGKSTYLKQLALLQIMAQCGCYVPADYAYFRLCTQIFSRISHNDDFETESSAFMVEMKDMTYILEHVNADSLVVIDELGRSTSVEEGLGICHAICEQLLRSKAFVFFATHLLDLCGLETLYPNVQCFHFGAQVQTDEEGEEHYVSDHTLTKGTYNGPLYGFELASVSAMPATVVERARELATHMVQQKQSLHTSTADALREKAIVRFGRRVLQAVNDRDKPGIAAHLAALKQRQEPEQRYTQELAAAEAADAVENSQ